MKYLQWPGQKKVKIKDIVLERYESGLGYNKIVFSMENESKIEKIEWVFYKSEEKFNGEYKHEAEAAHIYVQVYFRLYFGSKQPFFGS